MSKVLDRLKKLYLEITPPFIFFLIMFNMLVISKAVSAGQRIIGVGELVTALVGALIAAKVVLIVNRLPFLNLYPRKPLIYSVLAKTVIFSFFMLLFSIIERELHFARHMGGFQPAWKHIMATFSWSMFLLREMWQFVLVLFYCTGAEITRVIGRDKVLEILFGRRK